MQELQQRVDEFNTVTEGLLSIPIKIVSGMVNVLLHVLLIYPLYKSLLWMLDKSNDRGKNKVAKRSLKKAAKGILGEIERSLKENVKRIFVTGTKDDGKVRILFGIGISNLVDIVEANTREDFGGNERSDLRNGLFSAVDNLFGNKKTYNIVSLAVQEYHEEDITRALMLEFRMDREDAKRISKSARVVEAGGELSGKEILIGITLSID